MPLRERATASMKPDRLGQAGGRRLTHPLQTLPALDGQDLLPHAKRSSIFGSEAQAQVTWSSEQSED